MSNYCFKSLRYLSSASRSKYHPRQIEKKWQEKWSQELKKEQSFSLADKEEKCYVLSMFPYPSGKLHMGHVRVYTISDCIGRYNRMNGKKVLHPIGWDSFGLPAENAAIEREINPKDWTNHNIEQMRGQLLNLGIHFDWSQELSTCNPQYYKWTQWLFLQLYKHGLVYKKSAPVNWDPVDCTVLANEQVDADGFAWRSGAKVEQRFLNQWFVKITDYSERLLTGLDDLDWPNNVKRMQQDWIGRSDGFYFDYKIEHRLEDSVRVFTTRPDTIYGVTFIGLSPEHPLLAKLDLSDNVREQIADLVNDSADVNKYKDRKGVNLHLNAIHPLTHNTIPVYVVNYVVDYGSQAIMGVPGHDERDRDFADSAGMGSAVCVLNEDESILINSKEFTGMENSVARLKIMEKAKSVGVGDHMTQYKLRDWLISRQRYWGTPIPVINCDKCGIVPDYSLPVVLPESLDFKQGSLASLQDEKWRKVNCGKEGGCVGVRETDTMDTFVDSSWYFMRYPDTHNDKEMICNSLAKQWLPVDVYIGGIEHANLHLLYARFISYFLYDIGIHNQPEPFRKLISQGMVHGKTYYLKKTGQYLRTDEINKYSSDELKVKWQKMSKSKHNGVDPDSCIEDYGADVVRAFMLFKAPPEKEIQWDIEAIKGIYSWIFKVQKLINGHNKCSSEHNHTPKTDDINQLVIAREKAIKQVTAALEESYKFNVAVSELMKLSNTLKSLSQPLMGSIEYHNTLLVLCKLMFPFVPHFSAQIWEELRQASSNLDFKQDPQEMNKQHWPSLKKPCTEDMEVAVMINGVIETTLLISNESSLDSRKELAIESIGKMNNKITKIIIAPHGRAINILTT